MDMQQDRKKGNDACNIRVKATGLVHSWGHEVASDEGSGGQ